LVVLNDLMTAAHMAAVACVCSTLDRRKSVVTTLTERGVHLLLDKPAARTAAQARELGEIAERAGVVAIPGHALRFHPAVLRAVASVARGDIGLPGRFRGSCCSLKGRASGKTERSPTVSVTAWTLYEYFIGPTDTLVLPAMSAEVDWEIELAVVVGQRCRNVPVERALDVVAGYMTATDVYARSVDFPFDRSARHVAPFFDWLIGKWPDGFAPLGPYLVSSNDVRDPNNLELYLDVNGTVHQRGSTSDMIFGVAELIAFASMFMTLELGDIIETGAPAGVGAASSTYLKPGDAMTARVGDLGVQRPPVVASPA
jgi:2-keto-4-pentenoate hydratase/2-oxohepta-3-ene-1,7-dioic acid hydratase in catechol pathway